jgi:PTH2 family peptidyl-tRNA hydrolase
VADAKQVIVIRKDLNMRKGKMIAQGAHASLAVILDLIRKANWQESDLPSPVIEWLRGRFTKIVVYVNSEQELFDVHKKAEEAGIPCSLIRDAGLTEFKEPTYTAVGIGPDEPEKIDLITGTLPLL